jgi:hypothetical protein
MGWHALAGGGGGRAGTRGQGGGIKRESAPAGTCAGLLLTYLKPARDRRDDADDDGQWMIF